jgi:hypothetical protein
MSVRKLFILPLLLHLVVYYHRNIILKEIVEKDIKVYCVQIVSQDIVDPVHLNANCVLIKLQIL